ncbi:MAG: response regulator [Opitutales bacterium]
MAVSILVAEDDFVSRKLICTNLKQMGYELQIAEDGEQAWRMYQTMPTRIVVSDWLMPNMDGIEFCQRVRSHPGPDYTYFIMLTANVAERENYYHAMEAGVDDFLSKPLDRVELRLRLKVAERILMSTNRIRSLENVLTICSYTKRVKIPDAGWATIEEFMQKHLGMTVSHGVDPDHYENEIKPQIEALKREPPALGSQNPFQ